MNTEQALSEIGYFLDRARTKLLGVDGRVTEALRHLKADAQALADVRTLDEWAKANGARWSCTPWNDGWAVCIRRGPHADLSPHHAGPTPDAARHAAAEWVRGQAQVAVAVAPPCTCPGRDKNEHDAQRCEIRWGRK